MNSHPPTFSGAFPVAAQDHREQFFVIGASAAVFAIACAIPALTFQNLSGTEQSWCGGLVFLHGWKGPIVGQFAWFANLFLFGSWMSAGFRWRPGAVLFAAGALLIAAQSFALFGEAIPADEGGFNKLTLTRLMPGFYVWIASIVIALAGGFFVRGRNKNNR
jgi:hypothetical protein